MQGEPFQIKVAKIRGEESQGMICAEDEIGLSANHDGILVLHTALTNGTPASTLFDVYTDTHLEIGLTPNRADAASHLGVARDIKAVTCREIRWPSVEAFKVDQNQRHIPVEVLSTEGCLRYSYVTLTGIRVTDSPAWLKNRLRSIGLTPINNIVDITNFVLHETGQPLHAFDADAIAGGKVIVKTMPEGSSFTTLDGKERKLLAGDLMICDTREGMCMAGVFGGVKSGISANTTSVFLESACFSPQYIRKTSMHHGLKTDASFRFERGTDPNLTVYALKRASLLIREIAGGQIASEVSDIYPSPVHNRQVVVKDRNVNRLIGKVIPRSEVLAILQRLDITVTSETADTFVVSVPPYRVDVVNEADIVEEVLRIYGFDRVELRDEAGTDFISGFPEKDATKFQRTLGELLAGNGFYEIWTNSLTHAAYQQRHQLVFEGEPVEILNKLSEEQGILRQTLLFTGLEVCAYNINRKQKDLKLFEFGKVYSKVSGQYREKEQLALYMTGNLQAESWQQKTQEVNYHHMAQQVSHVLNRCGLTSVTQEAITNDPLVEYGIKLSTKNTRIGTVGKVKPAFLKDFGIKQAVFYAELDSALLFQSASPKLVLREVPRFPEVRRDLSLVLDKHIAYDQVVQLVNKTEKQLIKNIIAFDVYEGKNIAENKKAYALGFILLNETKTLTDEEIDQTMNRLMNAFEQELGAVIRK
jgi:phenylalanyl-tRNA synthetase beta chain